MEVTIFIYIFYIITLFGALAVVLWAIQQFIILLKDMGDMD